MWPWNRRDITPVGVEFDGPVIRLAQLEFRVGQVPHVRLLSRALPAASQQGETQARITAATRTLRRFLSEGGFVGRRVVPHLPDELVHLRTLRLVRESSGSLDEAVRRDSRSLFPFPPEQLQLHHIEAGQSRYGNEPREEVIVAASPRSEVEQFLAAFDRAGLRVAGLDLGPCAAYRACCRSATDPREIHSLLEIGHTCSHVMIGRGAQIRFIKRVGIGAEHLARAVSRRLGIAAEDAARIYGRLASGIDETPERRTIRRAASQACRPLLDGLAAEVCGCLRYYGVSFRGRPIERLLVSGRGAADPQLRTILSTAVSVPVQLLEAAADLHAPFPISDSTAWSVALGLALKSVAPATADRQPGQSRAAAAGLSGPAVQA